LNKESDDRIYYAVFDDDPQRVLIFSKDTSIIEDVSDVRFHLDLKIISNK
jgi:hypothetical protein